MGKVARRKSAEKEDAMARSVVNATVPDTAEKGHHSEDLTPSTDLSSTDSSKKTRSSKKASIKKKKTVAKSTEEPAAPLPANLSESMVSTTSSSKKKNKKSKRSKSLDKATDVMAMSEAKTKVRESMSQMSASDVPVPTELNRHTSQPGAFRQAGIEDDNPPDYDDDEPPEAPRSSTPVESKPIPVEAPLLTATLVVEDDEEKASPAPAAAIVAHAEPMDDDDKDDQKSPAPPASRRRLHCMIFLLALLCCGAVGVIVGLLLSGDSGNDDDTSPSAAIDDGEDLDDGGVTDDQDAEEIHRMYYVLKWGAGSLGCKNGPPKYDMHISCSGTDLVFLDGENVACEATNNVNMKCHADKVNDNGPGPLRRSLQEFFTPQDSRIASASLLVACEGLLSEHDGADFLLETSLEEPFDSITECGFTWIRERNDGLDGSSTELMGGTGAVVVTGGVLCPGDIEDDVELSDEIHCTDAGQIDQTAETQFCVTGDVCHIVRADCRPPPSNPCEGVKCPIQGETIKSSFGSVPCVDDVNNPGKFICEEHACLVSADDSAAWDTDTLWVQAALLPEPRQILRPMMDDKKIQLQDLDLLFLG